MKTEMIDSLRGKTTGWVVNLPEVGSPLLSETRYVEELRLKLMNAEKELRISVKAHWTREQINEAKRITKQEIRERLIPTPAISGNLVEVL